MVKRVSGLVCACAFAMVSTLAFAQTRAGEGASVEEFAANPRMRDLQQTSPELYGRVLSDVNAGVAANADTADELAATSPALSDLQRTSPEALLDLFMLLKGGSNKNGSVPR